MVNEKQKKFCDLYLLSLNASQSAVDAGYNKHTAGMLMANKAVKDYLKQRMNDVDYTRIATLDEILAKLTSIVRGDYFNDDDKKTRVSNIIRACELLGKRYGAWEEAKNYNIENLTIVNDIPLSQPDCSTIDCINMDDIIQSDSQLPHTLK